VVATIADAVLEQRIAEIVAARRPMLEQLVRERVNAELVAIVDASSTPRSNGSPRATARRPRRCSARAAANVRASPAAPSATAAAPLELASGARRRAPTTRPVASKPRTTARPRAAPGTLGRPRSDHEPVGRVSSRRDDEHAHAAAQRAGVTARELVEHNRRRHATLTARELERWLVGSALAVEHDGQLAPTPLAVELGAALV
jgi:hypothetical protein